MKSQTFNFLTINSESRKAANQSRHTIKKVNFTNMKPQDKNNILKVNRQTITRLNNSAMNQVNGGAQYPTVGNDMSAIMFNCNSSCVPTFNADVYCNPTLPTIINVEA